MQAGGKQRRQRRRRRETGGGAGPPAAARDFKPSPSPLERMLGPGERQKPAPPSKAARMALRTLTPSGAATLSAMAANLAAARPAPPPPAHCSPPRQQPRRLAGC